MEYLEDLENYLENINIFEKKINFILDVNHGSGFFLFNYIYNKEKYCLIEEGIEKHDQSLIYFNNELYFYPYHYFLNYYFEDQLNELKIFKNYFEEKEFEIKYILCISYPFSLSSDSNIISNLINFSNKSLKIVLTRFKDDNEDWLEELDLSNINPVNLQKSVETILKETYDKEFELYTFSQRPLTELRIEENRKFLLD